jgi:hypothetical protein
LKNNSLTYEFLTWLALSNERNAKCNSIFSFYCSSFFLALPLTVQWPVTIRYKVEGRDLLLAENSIHLLGPSWRIFLTRLPKLNMFRFIRSFDLLTSFCLPGDNYDGRKQMDNKTEQWFGATVSSSGREEGPIVVSFNVHRVVYWHHWRTIDSLNSLYRITEAICPYLPRMTALFYHGMTIRYSGNVRHDIDGQRPQMIFFPGDDVANTSNLPARYRDTLNSCGFRAAQGERYVDDCYFFRVKKYFSSKITGTTWFMFR